MGIFGGPRAKKILEGGDEVPARIVGIEVDYTKDDDGDTVRCVDKYAVALADGRTIGIQQNLSPLEEVRLGMAVRARVLGDRGVILWNQTITDGHKALKSPPAEGIVDLERRLQKAKKKGSPVSITLTAVDDRSYFGGLASRRRATVTVALEGVEPYEAVIKDFEVPFYASHLYELHRTFPGWVRLDKLDRPAIDWAAAATAEPGVGSPPAGATSGAEPAHTPMASESGLPVEEQVQAAADGALVFGGVDLATYAAIEASLQRDRVRPDRYDAHARAMGAPEGTKWSDVVSAWMQASSSDWRVGAAAAEAIEAAKKAAER